MAELTDEEKDAISIAAARRERCWRRSATDGWRRSWRRAGQPRG